MHGEKRRELERPPLVPTRGSEARGVPLYNRKEGGGATVGESDPFIVLGGWESQLQGEGMEERAQALQQTAAGTKRPERLLPSSLRAIATKARTDSGHRFGGLYSLLNRSNLRAAYFRLNRKASSGVDGVSYADYGKDLDAHVDELVEQLRGKRYRAKLVRRVHIPKGLNATRPLGILCTSDKLAQRVAADILEAIYEQDFADFSYAYRRGRSTRDAVRALRDGIMGNRCSWVVELDIKGYYDSIDHSLLMEMLKQRVSDGAFLRLIGKWLRAGVLDTDGKVLHPATGTPQGGIVSCVLANIYLHHVLDEWFEKEFRPTCEGDATLVRYADDIVAAFQYHRDASRFYRAAEERMRKFALALSKHKSGIKKFCRACKRESERFDFLGFEFRWGRSRLRKNKIKLRTSRKKLAASIATLTAWIREHRNKRMRWIFAELNAKLRGYYGYYGVTDNHDSMYSLYDVIQRLLYKWLNRRSERRSYNWKTFRQMLKHYALEKPRTVWGLYKEQMELSLA